MSHFLRVVNDLVLRSFNYLKVLFRLENQNEKKNVFGDVGGSLQHFRV